jgi:hypothetical protein
VRRQLLLPVMIFEVDNGKTNHIFIMNNQAMTRDEDMVKFFKPKDKMDKGF